MKGLESRPRRRERETPLPPVGISSRAILSTWGSKTRPHPSHARRHDAPKQGPTCQKSQFTTFARTILRTTDIDERPALAYMGERNGAPIPSHARAVPDSVPAVPELRPRACGRYLKMKFWRHKIAPRDHIPRACGRYLTAAQIPSFTMRIPSRVWAVLDGGLGLRFSEVLVLARVGGPYLQVDIFDSQIPAPRPAPCPRLPKQRLKDRDLAPLARDPDDGGRLHSHFGNALPPSQNLDVLTNGNLKNCHRHAWTRL